MLGRRKSRRKDRAKQKRIQRIAFKEKTEKRIRLHGEGLAEEMNLRLICSMGEKNTLWVDSVTVVEIIFPDDKKNKKKKRKKGFLCRLQNNFRDYRWIT